MVTATARDPTNTSEDEGMVTVICVPVRALGLNLSAPKFTAASSTKFVPLMVSVSEGEPATADAGEKDETLGSGLGMINCAARDSSWAQASAQMHESTRHRTKKRLREPPR